MSTENNITDNAATQRPATVSDSIAASGAAPVSENADTAGNDAAAGSTAAAPPPASDSSDEQAATPATSGGRMQEADAESDSIAASSTAPVSGNADMAGGDSAASSASAAQPPASDSTSEQTTTPATSGGRMQEAAAESDGMTASGAAPVSGNADTAGNDAAAGSTAVAQPPASDSSDGQPATPATSSGLTQEADAASDGMTASGAAPVSGNAGTAGNDAAVAPPPASDSTNEQTATPATSSGRMQEAAATSDGIAASGAAPVSENAAAAAGSTAAAQPPASDSSGEQTATPATSGGLTQEADAESDGMTASGAAPVSGNADAAGNDAAASSADSASANTATHAESVALAVSGGIHTLRAASLFKRFGHKSVVQGIDFKMHTGEVLGLLGPNGAGKTTTFYMIVGFYRPTAGEIFLDEERITALPMYRRARQGISYLPQEPSVFKKLTVEENIWAILETRKDLTRAQKLERLEELIEEFAIGRIRKQMAFTLSGGERRRTEIARSLAIEPKFLLLDEPFAGIDPIAVADIKNMIGLLSKRGIGILITDHNVRDTLEITTRAIIISSGQIMIQGSKQEILDSPLAREVYLGKDFSM